MKSLLALQPLAAARPALNMVYTQKQLFRLLFILLFCLLPLLTAAQRKDIIPIVECVKYTGNGKYQATFGYDNPNSKEVSVAESNSYLTYQGTKPNGKPVSAFKTGRQSNVFSIEFDGKKVSWSILLPNGKTVYVETSLQAYPCQNSTGFSYYNYPMPEGGKSTKKTGAYLPSLYKAGSDGSSDEIFQLKGEYVLLDLYARDGMRAELLSDAKALGLTEEQLSPFNSQQITGNFPVAQLAALETLSSLKFAEPVFSPLGNAGLTSTQGDKAQRSDIARLGFKVDGSGIKVGVLSDSYNYKGAAATDVENGDLPASVQLLKDASGSDEGRAMLQLIHDVAPGADLAFRSAFYGAADFAQGILDLQNPAIAACDIIVDDITYINQPFFQDGVVAQAVDQVTAQGAAYFSAAGNYGQKSYASTFSPTTAPAGISGKAHNFNGGDLLQQIALSPGVYTLVLQWDDRFASLGQGGSQTDLDIYLADNTGKILYGFNRNNLGNDPVEVLPIVVGGEGAITNLMIIQAGSSVSPAPKPALKYIIFRGDLAITEFNTNSPTIVGQANAAGANAVGAVLFSNTPEYGVNPPTIASFSSRGGTPILRSTDGSPIPASVRAKPEFTAPNGGNTTVTLAPQPAGFSDGDLFPNFFGTSAAAPHAAGVAALLLEAQQKYLGTALSPTELRNILQTTALDMASPDFDYTSGWGFIQADEALGTIASPTPVLTSLSAATSPTVGGGPYEITIEGEFLTSTSIAYFNGEALATTYVNANQLKASIAVFTGNYPVQVYNPPMVAGGSDGGFSKPLYFFSNPTITISADHKTKRFGERLPTFTASISGLPAGVTAAELGLVDFDFSTNASDLSNAGFYTITVSKSGLANTNEYTFVFQNGSLLIERVELVVLANDHTLTYGDPLAGFTYSYQLPEDFNNAETVKNTITAEIKQTHAIAIANGIAIANATAMVDAIAIANALENRSFLISGTAIANATAIANGTKAYYLDSEDLVNTTSFVNATAIANGIAMVDAIAIANGIAMVDGIAIANGTAIANSEEETLLGNGSNEKTLVIFNGETEITALQPIPLITGITAGTHRIVPPALTPPTVIGNNFVVTYGRLGTLTILPAPLQVKADDKVICYGDPLPEFTATISGFVNEETAANLSGELRYQVSDFSSSGAYSITPSGLSAANYDISFVNGSLFANPDGPGVGPFLECVEQLTAHPEGYSYRAHFSYENFNKSSIYLPVGQKNWISSDGRYQIEGAIPTTFIPGGRRFAFSMLFDGQESTWNVNICSDEVYSSAVASASSAGSNRCNDRAITSRISRDEGNYEEQQIRFAFYPNPVADQLNIDLSEYQGVTVSIAIYDMMGRHQFTRTLQSQGEAVKLDMRNLKAGLYLLKLDSQGTSRQLKVMKQ